MTLRQGVASLMVCKCTSGKSTLLQLLPVHFVVSNLNLASSEACLAASIGNCMAVVGNRFLKILSSLLVTQVHVSDLFQRYVMLKPVA
jgi:hypothetical protein